MRFVHRSQNRNIKGFVLFIVFSIAFAACGKSESAGGNNGGKAETEKPQTISISVGKAEAREVPAYIQATGSLVADETSDIAPKAAGKVVNIYANVGQFVGKGKRLTLSHVAS